MGEDMGKEQGNDVATDIHVDMPAPQVRERVARGAPGLPVLGAGLLVVIGGVALLVWGANLADGGSGAVGTLVIVLAVLVILGGLITLRGLNMVAPGEARVVQLLGRYTGTIRADGLRWVNPISSRRKVSTRIRNHETSVLKVNDADGNPIEIASVVVWQVDDTARAMFEVDNFVQFVDTQTETAVRHIATSYPYDAHSEKH
ncbi:MAG: SPFH domain-containing protein, partial [Sciscionella sp.]